MNLQLFWSRWVFFLNRIKAVVGGPRHFHPSLFHFSSCVAPKSYPSMPLCHCISVYIWKEMSLSSFLFLSPKTEGILMRYGERYCFPYNHVQHHIMYRTGKLSTWNLNSKLCPDIYGYFAKTLINFRARHPHISLCVEQGQIPQYRYKWLRRSQNRYIWQENFNLLFVSFLRMTGGCAEVVALERKPWHSIVASGVFTVIRISTSGETWWRIFTTNCC